MDMRWVEIDSWHIVKETRTDGNQWFVEMLCGLERIWDQTFLDRLPGGSERSCENCLKIHTRATDEPETPVKKTRKARSK
jgi:hypothetical protein